MLLLLVRQRLQGYDLPVTGKEPLSSSHLLLLPTESRSVFPLWQVQWCLCFPIGGPGGKPSPKYFTAWAVTTEAMRVTLPVTSSLQGTQILWNNSNLEWEGEIRPHLYEFQRSKVRWHVTWASCTWACWLPAWAPNSSEELQELL